ncbi:hypothetical protein ACIGEZ_07470 [Streptomyces sp. NPDC085481]|uniref:hypothetical protein n=1 Tax=Streptomyces sp. NPDC085481 TaxID=3365727 RepID=UPI0037D90292
MSTKLLRSILASVFIGAAAVGALAVSDPVWDSTPAGVVAAPNDPVWDVAPARQIDPVWDTGRADTEA